MKEYYKNMDTELTDNSILLLTIFPPGFDSELEFITKNSKETVKKDEFFYLYKLTLD